MSATLINGPKTGFAELESVQLRECFPHEARDFTPWLATAENLAALGRAVGLELEHEGTEVAVGPYCADILATDGEAPVIIENQLERTDHDHLGKVLTYAAGLDAKAVVWIAESFTPEHKRAVDFLNEVTTEDLRVFAVEMRMFRIERSAPAPQFHVVAGPNAYYRSVTTKRKPTGELSQRQELYLRFWTRWLEEARSRGTALTLRSPRGSARLHLPLAPAKCWLRVSASTQDRRVGCELLIKRGYVDVVLPALEEQREALEKELGEIVWSTGPSQRRIGQHKRGFDVADESSWPKAHEWLLERAEAFYRAFAPRLRHIEAPAGADDDDEDM